MADYDEAVDNKGDKAMADVGAPQLRKAGGWVMVWGVLMIFAGILAILEPPIAAMAA